jgi:hypothetical protein
MLYQLSEKLPTHLIVAPLSCAIPAGYRRAALMGTLIDEVELAFGHHEDRSPTHGYAESREAAMAAFAKSWRRE